LATVDWSCEKFATNRRFKFLPKEIKISDEIKGVNICDFRTVHFFQSQKASSNRNPSVYWKSQLAQR